MLQMQQSSVIMATLQNFMFIKEAEGEGTAHIYLLFALLAFTILTSLSLGPVHSSYHLVSLPYSNKTLPPSISFVPLLSNILQSICYSYNHTIIHILFYTIAL